MPGDQGHDHAMCEDVAEEQRQDDVWRYAIGDDDLVYGGVVYDRREWMVDAEGDLVRRDVWLKEQGLAGCERCGDVVDSDELDDLCGLCASCEAYNAARVTL
jgi:hypothetical protein